MITLPTYDIEEAGSIVGAAQLMGTTRHAVKRRIVKHGIRWHRDGHIVGQQPALASVELPKR